jgi:hypothetical protein
MAPKKKVTGLSKLQIGPRRQPNIADWSGAWSAQR